MAFEWHEELTEALDALVTLEEQDLIAVDPDFHSNRTLTPGPIEGAYPVMMHLPIDGDSSFLTIDGDPNDTGEGSAPIQERMVRVKCRLLLMRAADFNDNPAAAYDLLLKWINAYPTFAALHRELKVDDVAYCRRFKVAEREANQQWALTEFNYQNEDHLGIEWQASITYDATLKVGQ